MQTLLEVLDHHFQHYKFNKRNATELFKYHVRYVNQNPEHLEFFGGNLLGVQVVHFTTRDLNRLFDEVLDVDYVTLTQDILKCPAINPNFKVSSDTTNIVCMYLIHKWLTCPTMSANERVRAAFDVALIFFYRCTAILLSDWFKYPADERIVKVAYGRLSQKFLLKRLGTWQALMEYRAKFLIDSKTSIHYKNLLTFQDDYATVYAINDSQGAIRSIMKGYYAEFDRAHSEGESIGTTSSTWIDADGDEQLREVTVGTEAMVTYMRGILAEPHNFVKEDILAVIAKINTNTSTRMIRAVLTWMAENYNTPKHHKLIDEFVSTTIVYSAYLIESNLQVPNRRDYAAIISGLKNLYLSSRSTETELLHTRELGRKIIEASHPASKSDSLNKATRTAMILYVTLRALIGSRA